MARIRPQSRWLVYSVVTLVLASALGGLRARGADPSTDAKRNRAEIERKQREIKKKIEDHRREVKAGPQGLRSGAAPAARRGAAADSAGSQFKLKPSALQYSPKRGQDYAFRIAISTDQKIGQRRWSGTVYFAGIYSDTLGAPGEMLCIGRLACERPAGEGWTRLPEEDVRFPQHFRFGSSSVLNAQTADTFHKHTLPFQLSAIIPLEEVIFPDIPIFSNDNHNDYRGDATFSLRRGESFMGTIDLKGERRQSCHVEQENSASPRVINERSFLCPDPKIELELRQVSGFDVQDGMVTDSDLDYRLLLEGELHLKITVRRLTGADLASARSAALREFPPSAWPACFHRVPARDGDFEIGIVRLSDRVSVGQRVSVSLDVSEGNSKAFRQYLATVLAPFPGDQSDKPDKLRVLLDGSNEELDVHHTSVHLPRKR